MICVPTFSRIKAFQQSKAMRLTTLNKRLDFGVIPYLYLVKDISELFSLQLYFNFSMTCKNLWQICSYYTRQN